MTSIGFRVALLKLTLDGKKVIAEQSDEGLTVTMRTSSAISGNTYPLLAIRYSLFAITCSLLTIRQIPTPTSQSR